MKLNHFWMTALLFAAPTVALAEHRAPNPQRHEIRKDRREQRDDRRDEAALQHLLSRLDRYAHRRDIRGIREVDLELQHQIATEIRETRRELRADRREVHQSRHKLTRESWYSPRPVVWDARHDVRDDVRDLRAEARTMSRLQDIEAQVQSLRGRYDRRSVLLRRTVLGELIHLARFEQFQNREEVHEDRAERREDGWVRRW